MKIKQADEMETLLCKKFMRFLAQVSRACAARGSLWMLPLRYR